MQKLFESGDVEDFIRGGLGGVDCELIIYFHFELAINFEQTVGQIWGQSNTLWVTLGAFPPLTGADFWKGGGWLELGFFVEGVAGEGRGEGFFTVAGAIFGGVERSQRSVYPAPEGVV